MVDYRYLTDALTPKESLEILLRAEPGRAERAAMLRSSGYPAYTTSPGWLGYSDAELQRLAGEAIADGFTQIKLKVGASIEEDVHRMGLARDVVGPDIRIAVDANQRWDVGAAVEWMKRLAAYDPYWIEEPTSPDDILGHAPSVGRYLPSRWPLASTSLTGSSSSNCYRQTPWTSCRSTRPVSAASMRTSRSCCSPQSSGCRSAHTQAVSDCARWSSTCRCSTSSPSRAPTGPGHRVRRPFARALRRPGAYVDGHYLAPAAPG